MESTKKKKKKNLNLGKLESLAKCGPLVQQIWTQFKYTKIFSPWMKSLSSKVFFQQFCSERETCKRRLGNTPARGSDPDPGPTVAGPPPARGAARCWSPADCNHRAITASPLPSPAEEAAPPPPPCLWDLRWGATWFESIRPCFLSDQRLEIWFKGKIIQICRRIGAE